MNSSTDNAEQRNNSNAKMERPLVPGLELLKSIFKFLPNATTDSKHNKTNASQVVVFYDFQIMSDDIGPPFMISEPLNSPEMRQAAVNRRELKDVKRTSASHMLSIDAEGTFVAASSKLHPLLRQMIRAGCQRMTPKCAVRNTLFTQCSGLLQDVYCNNVYIL